MQNYEYDEDLCSYLRDMNTSSYNQPPQSHVVSSSMHVSSQKDIQAGGIDDESFITWQGHTSTKYHSSACEGPVTDFGYSVVKEIKARVKKEDDNVSHNALVTSKTMNMQDHKYDEDLCSFLKDMNTSSYSQPPQSHVVPPAMHVTSQTTTNAGSVDDESLVTWQGQTSINYHTSACQDPVTDMGYLGVKEIKPRVKTEVGNLSHNAFVTNKIMIMQDYKYDEVLCSFLKDMNASSYSQPPHSHVVPSTNHVVTQVPPKAASDDDISCVTWKGITSANYHASTRDGPVTDMEFSGVKEIKARVKEEIDTVSHNALVTSKRINMRNYKYDEDLCSYLRDINVPPCNQPPQSHVASSTIHVVPPTVSIADKSCDTWNTITNYRSKGFGDSIAEMVFPGMEEIMAQVKTELDKGASNVFSTKDPNPTIVSTANSVRNEAKLHNKMSECRTNPASIIHLHKMREPNTDREYDPVSNMAVLKGEKGLFSTFNTSLKNAAVSLVKPGLIVASVLTTAFVLRKRFF